MDNDVVNKSINAFDMGEFLTWLSAGQNRYVVLWIIVIIIFVLFILTKIFRKKNQSKNRKYSSVYDGLNKSRDGFICKLNDIFSSTKEKDEILSNIEELLISSDVGVDSANFLCMKLKDGLNKIKDFNQDAVMAFLKDNIEKILGDAKEILFENCPKIIMVVGVNGVGKTTTIAKLSSKWIKKGKKVLLVAADTFRAAAVEQLEYWGKEVGADIVKGKQNDKPVTVVFDAMKKIKEEQYDIVLIDTAGRLQNKSNLMQELSGIQNAVNKNLGRNADEIILVLDGTSGQNALSQAKEFNHAVTLTGIIITKLDGTAKGGILIAVKRELNIPIYFIGIGESSEDLISFNPGDFASALLFTRRQEVRDTINSKKRREFTKDNS